MGLHPFIRIFGTAAAVWAAGWMILSGRSGRAKAGKHAAIAPSDPAADLDQGPVSVRAAGLQSMRDGKGLAWDRVDEASDASFPASDPPSTLGAR